MAVYSSSPSQDLTAAWYAAAPPPPPPQSRNQQQKRASMAALPGQNTYSNQAYDQPQRDSLRTSSSSTSLSFDRRVKGDDLPRDSHSPAPERPVSRNAMAKQRERERQRARTNSTSNYGQNFESPAFDQEQGQSVVQHLQMEAVMPPNRSPSPGPRNRRESSPAAPGNHSAYYQDPQYAQQQAAVSYDTAQKATYHQPSTEIFQQPPMVAYTPYQTVPSPMQPPPNPGFIPQQYGYQAAPQYSHPIQPQPQYSVYQNGHVSAPQTPAQYSQGHWPHPTGQQQVFVAEPMSMPQTPIYAGTPIISPHPNGHPINTPQTFAVPFPTSSVMPPPPIPAVQQSPYPASVYNTPPTVNGRPLPSPSRTSSQSSSVDTRASTTSLGSASGTIRRTLPQVPQGRSESNPQRSVPSRQSDIPASLGRHESVRMAAEEIMSRGLPNRRKGMPFSTRTQSGVSTHANSSRSDGSITDGTLPGIGPNKASTPMPANQRHRAESASCVENEMRALKLNGKNDEPFVPARAPLTSIQPSVAVPTSNVPIRASSPRPIRAAPTPAPEVTIGSPVDEIIPRRPLSRGPKDERERKRSMDAQAAAAAAAAASNTPRPPSILVNDNPGIPSIVIPGEEDETPSIQVSGPPEICISTEHESEKPTGTISISVSSSGIAQRSTSSYDINGNRSSISSIARQRVASKPFMAPEPASAPSMGSGAGCASCQKWIGGRVVHAMGHTFHPDCFVCSHCSEALEHVAFYEHEGQPYCHFDFHELFSKRCFHCRTPIVDQRYITINDVELVGGEGGDGHSSGGGESQERCYHDMHFFCANCGDPFLDPKLASSAAGGGQNEILAEIEDENGTVRYGGREFVVHKGYPYCENCHVSLHKPKCKGCKKPIIDEEYLTALRGKWHIGCFCCFRCQIPIDSDNFFVRDGQAYDEECYKIKLRSEL